VVAKIHVLGDHPLGQLPLDLVQHGGQHERHKPRSRRSPIQGTSFDPRRIMVCRQSLSPAGSSTSSAGRVSRNLSGMNLSGSKVDEDACANRHGESSQRNTVRRRYLPCYYWHRWMQPQRLLHHGRHAGRGAYQGRSPASTKSLDPNLSLLRSLHATCASCLGGEAGWP
jgi:hypothetical protein